MAVRTCTGRALLAALAFSTLAPALAMKHETIDTSGGCDTASTCSGHGACANATAWFVYNVTTAADPSGTQSNVTYINSTSDCVCDIGWVNASTEDGACKGGKHCCYQQKEQLTAFLLALFTGYTGAHWW